MGRRWKRRRSCRSESLFLLPFAFGRVRPTEGVWLGKWSARRIGHRDVLRRRLLTHEGFPGTGGYSSARPCWLWPGVARNRNFHLKNLGNSQKPPETLGKFFGTAGRFESLDQGSLYT